MRGQRAAPRPAEPERRGEEAQRHRADVAHEHARAAGRLTTKNGSVAAASANNATAGTSGDDGADSRTRRSR